MSADAPIVVFDGVCHICNHWVDFILRRDRSGRLRLASMQSPAGEWLIERCGYQAATLPTLLLIEDGVYYSNTDAIFRVLRHLGGGWRLADGLRVIPRRLRDYAYLAIARNRYRLFGRRSSCRLPSAAERERFVQDLSDLGPLLNRTREGFKRAGT